MRRQLDEKAYLHKREAIVSDFQKKLYRNLNSSKTLEVLKVIVKAVCIFTVLLQGVVEGKTSFQKPGTAEVQL